MIACRIKDYTISDDEGTTTVSGEVWVGTWEGDTFSYAIFDLYKGNHVLGGTGSATREEFADMVVESVEIFK